MSSPSDHESPQGANPYQSPAHSGWADDPVAFLQQLPGGAIEVRGSLQPHDVFLAHFGTSCGFTGLVFRQVGAAILLLLGLLFFTALSLSSLLSPERFVPFPPVFGGLLFLGVDASIFLMLLLTGRSWASARHLKRLWNERRGIFAEEARRVTPLEIISDSAEGQIQTPWIDYDYYRLSRNRLRLHLSILGISIRRQQRPEGGILWKAGMRWYDGIDIFPREQFTSREDWQLFVRVVKKKLHRMW